MTVKHAVGGIPAGGGKGGVVVDPGELSPGKWSAWPALISVICPKGRPVDVPAPISAPTPRSWPGCWTSMNRLPIHSPAALNDKPAAAGGTVGSSEATGRGVFYVLRQAVKDYNLPLNSRVAVQGFGTVGSNLARLLDQEGFRVVAISDVYGALYAGDGINVEALAEFVRETGSVVGFPGAEAISNQDLLELAVEVLVPAAVQSCIHAGNGGAVKAKLVVEAANGPVTPEAEELLAAKAIPLVPDVLANVGGAIVCHFERIQGLTDDYWDIERVRQQLQDRILKAYAETTATAKELNISLRLAAWSNALRKIEAAIKTRGWV